MDLDVSIATEWNVAPTTYAGNVCVTVKDPCALEPEWLARRHAGDAASRLRHEFVIDEPQARLRELDLVVRIDILSLPLESTGFRSLHAAEVIRTASEQVVAAIGSTQVGRLQRCEFRFADGAPHAQIVLHRHVIHARTGLERGDAE